MQILYSTQCDPKINVEERHVIVPPAAVVELKAYCRGGMVNNKFTSQKFKISRLLFTSLLIHNRYEE
jgi:hypothetical protein